MVVFVTTLLIINSISRQHHLSVGGARPNYWGWMDVFRPHYLYLNGKLKYSAKYWHNINTNIKHSSETNSSALLLYISKISPKLFRTQLLSPSRCLNKEIIIETQGGTLFKTHSRHNFWWLGILSFSGLDTHTDIVIFSVEVFNSPTLLVFSTQWIHYQTLSMYIIRAPRQINIQSLAVKWRQARPALPPQWEDWLVRPGRNFVVIKTKLQCGSDIFHTNTRHLYIHSMPPPGAATTAQSET